MEFCNRKGVMCECLTDHSVCNTANCHRKLPDVETKVEGIIYPDAEEYTIRIPKKVATIKLCGGALTFDIDERMQWQRPTDEQIYNLKNLFAIEVIPED